MSEPHDTVLVLTTVPVPFDAAAFARTLVSERLAACVNILPEMRSIYAWKGDIEDEPERQVLMKTRRPLLPALEARLAALHPYEVPELIVLPIESGAQAYLAWVGEQTG